MNIADTLFVAIEYRLSLESGEKVDSSPEGEPLGFVVGSGRIIRGLEKALMGRAAGENARIVLEPEDAYGAVNGDLFQEVPKSKFPSDVEIKPGMAFEAQNPRGPIRLKVAKVNDNDTVTIDLNHPMAGNRLFFDVKIVEVREPLADELPQPSAGCGCNSPDQSPCGSRRDCGSHA